MKIAFFSVVLNHHQVSFCDEMYNLLGEDFVFVETTQLDDFKGNQVDTSQRPYLLQAWKSSANREKALDIASTFDVCLFDGSFEYQKFRLKNDLLTFEVSERWLKKGWLNVLSPRLLENIMCHHLRSWKNKPLYKLCSSAFARNDQRKLGTFKERCFKWGYFLPAENNLSYIGKSADEEVKLMWVARFLPLKHPEMVIKLAYSLRDRGYKFRIDMYGDGVLFERIERLRDAQSLHQIISMHGNVPNEEIRQAMREHDALLFTSDQEEGWGAVVNEAMSEGCIVVGSDAIGSVPYLIEDGVNGLQFKSEDDASLLQNVMWLIEHSEERAAMVQRAQETMKLWSPENAARSLLQLIDDLKNGRECSVKEGPCSKA